MKVFVKHSKVSHIHIVHLLLSLQMLLGGVGGVGREAQLWSCSRGLAMGGTEMMIQSHLHLMMPMVLLEKVRCV